MNLFGKRKDSLTYIINLILWDRERPLVEINFNFLKDFLRFFPFFFPIFFLSFFCTRIFPSSLSSSTCLISWFLIFYFLCCSFLFHSEIYEIYYTLNYSFLNQIFQFSIIIFPKSLPPRLLYLICIQLQPEFSNLSILQTNSQNFIHKTLLSCRIQIT